MNSISLQIISIVNRKAITDDNLASSNLKCFTHKIVVSFPTPLLLYYSFKNDKLKNEAVEDIFLVWLLKRIMKGPEIVVLSIKNFHFINKAYSEPTLWEN